MKSDAAWAREVNATFPTPDEYAKAIVLAAIDMCELSLLVKQPDDVLRGVVCFRGRWVAWQALCAVHLKANPRLIGRPIGCGPDPIGTFWSVRSQTWWSDARVSGLVAALASGAPLEPTRTPQTAYRVMTQVRDRIEERLS